MSHSVDRRLYIPVLVLLKPETSQAFNQLLIQAGWPEQDIHIVQGVEQIAIEADFVHDHAWLVFVDSSVVDPHRVEEILPSASAAFIVVSFENNRAHDLSFEPDVDFDHIIRAGWFCFEDQEQVGTFFQNLAEAIHRYVRDKFPCLQPPDHMILDNRPAVVVS